MADKEFLDFYSRRWEWSLHTFGPGPRTLGLTRHIRKELREIEAEPQKAEEWVDVVMLAMDGLARLGYTGEQVIQFLRAKHHINTNRKWNRASQDEPAEHRRD